MKILRTMVVKYYIKTFGCQMNHSDSERIAGFLEMKKLKPADDIKKANLVVFNTCGVRQSAENRVYGQIHNLKKKSASRRTKIKIILTGCLANRKDVQRRLKNKVDLFLPIKDILKLNHLKLFKNSKFKIKNSDTCDFDYLKMLPKYTSLFTAYVPIMTGCNNFCSYCVVPYARGREVSRTAEDIVKEIKSLAKNGCKEITLLGQNVNSYKFEIKKLKLFKNSKLKIKNCSLIDFPILLNLLAASYPYIKYKFITSHPKDFSDKLIKVIAKNKNISREIHLPIQAGSNKILKAMNRPYTQKQYLYLIKKIKKAIPKASFTTDIIVGFPGENKKDFLESVKVFKKVGFSEAYINKYSPRSGTAAWKLGNPIPWEEKKRREKILRNLIKNNEKLKK